MFCPVFGSGEVAEASQSSPDECLRRADMENTRNWRSNGVGGGGDGRCVFDRPLREKESAYQGVGGIVRQPRVRASQGVPDGG
jgi:hypothetical protein